MRTLPVHFVRKFSVWADDGLAETIVEEVPSGVEGTAQEAAESCPVSVISVE